MQITTPRGTLSSDGGNAELTWNSSFGGNTSKKFSRVQKIIDSEVLRKCDPYVPMQTGMLKKSGILGTVIGSGVVEYITPYARLQYYGNGGHGLEGTASGGKRGKMWFERMKANHKAEILRKAQGGMK